MTYIPSQPAVPATIIGPTSPCIGSTQAYSTTFVEGATSYQWTIPSGWSINSGQGTSSINVTVGSSSGNVCVRACNSCGCSSFRCKSILPVTSAPSNLVVFVAGGGLICYGDSVQIDAFASGGTGVYTYSWNNGLPDAPTHIVSPDFGLSTTYTVTVTDSIGCPAVSDSVTILVNFPLLITATGANICEGESATISVIASFGNGGPYYYRWYESDTTTLISTSSAITVSPPATTDYIVVVSDSCSLNDTSVVSVNVNELPNVNFFSDKSTGCTIIFTDTSKVYTTLSPFASDTLIVSWFWDFGDGTLMGPDSGVVTGVPNTSGTYTNPVHIYDVPGTYDVTVTVTDVNGCSSTLTITSMITYVAPTADFVPVPDSTTLANTTIQFTDLSTSPNGNIVSWEWDFDDGSPIETDQNPTHTYANNTTGTYSVMLIITDADGCTDTVWHIVYVGEGVGITKNELKPSVSIYPNPNTGLFTLMIDVQKNTNLSFNLYQIDGQLIFSEEVNNISGNYSQQLNLSKNARGIYYVQILTDSDVLIRKVVYQ